VLIQYRPVTDPELITLITAQQRELGEVAGGPDDHARYVVTVVDGRAVACGALLALDADTAEITGVYVRPAYRGRGIARQMLAALEEMALGAGHTVLRLDTRQMPAAVALCRSAGYAVDPRGVWFAKRLLVPA
jgi:GNAT superfamily N-acetyltransferase